METSGNLSVTDRVTELLNDSNQIPNQETDDTNDQVTTSESTEILDEQVTDDTGDIEQSDDNSEEETLKTITEIANYLDVEPEQMYSLEVPMSDGHDPITISEMKDKYIEQVRNHQQFEEEQTTFRQEKERFQQDMAQMKSESAAGVSAISQEVIESEGLLQAITAQYNSIDWEEAKQQDAGKAAMYRQELQEAYQKASMDKSSAIQKAQQESTQRYNEYANNEWQETVKVIPEWKSDETLRKDQAEMWEVAKEYNIDKNTFYKTVDHKLLHLLRDYAKLKNSVKNADVVAKKVKQSGVSFKRTGIRPITGEKKKVLQNKIQRAKKTHDMRDVTDAVTNLLNT